MDDRWKEMVLASDAARGNPEIAARLIAAAERTASPDSTTEPSHVREER